MLHDLSAGRDPQVKKHCSIFTKVDSNLEKNVQVGFSNPCRVRKDLIPFYAHWQIWKTPQ